MILDGQLMFTGGPGGIGAVGPGTSLRTVDLVTATGATSNNILDLAQGQTNTNAVALPPSASSPNAQPFRDIGIGDDPAMKILVQALVVPGTTGWQPPRQPLPSHCKARRTAAPVLLLASPPTTPRQRPLGRQSTPRPVVQG